MFKNGQLLNEASVVTFIKKYIKKINSLSDSEIKITNCWNWLSKRNVIVDKNSYSDFESYSYLPSQTAKQFFNNPDVVINNNCSFNVLDEFKKDLEKIRNRS